MHKEEPHFDASLNIRKLCETDQMSGTIDVLPLCFQCFDAIMIVLLYRYKEKYRHGGVPDRFRHNRDNRRYSGVRNE